MKKKIFALLLGLCFGVNSAVLASSYIDKQIKASKKAQKYNTVQKHTVKYDSSLVDISKKTNLKDPKLVEFESDKVQKVNEKAFAKKLQNDEVYYTKNVRDMLVKASRKSGNLGVDLYSLYRVFERIVRANKLDYMNWRVLLVTNTTEVNAYTTEANLVILNSSLFDSLYGNEDALAFILAHEISHQILGHTQQKVDKASKSEKVAKVLKVSTLGYGNLLYSPINNKLAAKESRQMEFEADALGAQLAVRAGYDFGTGMEGFNFLNALPSIESSDDTHPSTAKRIESLKEVKKYFLNQWVDEGKRNIYNSNPMGCKISSDMSSIVISSNGENKNGYYEPEAPEEMLKRISYISYLNGDMQKAVKYFTQWGEYSENYIPYLYLSYVYENLYNSTKQTKYLKKSQEAINIANRLSPNNEHVLKQFGVIGNLE